MTPSQPQPKTDGAPASLAPAPCSAVPGGKDGWTSNYKLCVKIQKRVRKKSGLLIYLETIDDVIIALKEMGYVTTTPNESR